MKDRAEGFIFSSYEFDRHHREAKFVYQVEFDKGKKSEFIERIVFPHPFPPDHHVSDELLDVSLSNLHFVAGLSYWKLYCPKKIEIKTHPLTRRQASFWNTVYTKGLGEFFYRNSLQSKGLIRFPADESAQTTSAIEAQLPPQSLVGIGGGKDSIVVMEEGKKKNLRFTGLIVETDKQNHIARAIAHTAGVQTLVVKRHIDPQVFELNKSRTVFNGHVPISSIYAFIGLLTGLLYGYNSFIVGNEKSADEANVIYHGEPINHQWSKSSEFEELFAEYLKSYVTPSFRYFSPLRSKLELEVIKEFVQYKQYLPVFSSCNRNFAITTSANSKWCGTCPKCAFVYVAMASVLPKHEVVKVFGKNLFDDLSLVPLYRQLLGKQDAKPFECVGTFAEVERAFRIVASNPEYQHDPVVTAAYSSGK